MNKIAKGMVWKILHQYSGYVVKLVVQTILARIMAPEEFGLLATVLAFINIAEILANSGMGTALVQKKDPDQKDYATVLTMSMGMSVIMYALLFFAAPLITAFYETPEITQILRIYGITLPINAYASVQGSYALKKYEIKKQFIASMTASILSAVVAIYLAYMGWGVWALIVQSFVSAIVTLLLMHVLVDWKPAFGFDLTRFRSMFSFGWKVMLSSLLGTLLENIYNMTIGKYYGNDVLGYYNRGNSFPNIVAGQLRNAIGTMALPIYSELQDDREKLLAAVKKMTQLSVFIIFPITFGLAAVAKPLIVVLLTEKWLPAVFFLQLECLFYGTLPLTTSIGTALSAIGRSDIGLKAEVLKLCLTVACVLALNTYAIEILCIARVVLALLIIFYYIVISRKLIGYGLKELFADLIKPLTVSAVMGGCVYAVSFLGLSNILTLLLQVCAGVSVYAIGTLLFMKDILNELLMRFLPKLAKRKDEQ